MGRGILLSLDIPKAQPPTKNFFDLCSLRLYPTLKVLSLSPGASSSRNTTRFFKKEYRLLIPLSCLLHFRVHQRTCIFLMKVIDLILFLSYSGHAQTRRKLTLLSMVFGSFLCCFSFIYCRGLVLQWKVADVLKSCVQKCMTLICWKLDVPLLTSYL